MKTNNLDFILFDLIGTTIKDEKEGNDLNGNATHPYIKFIQIAYSSGILPE